MRICIITATMPPLHCGIGDYSLKLAGTLRKQGNNVSIVAGRGESSNGVLIVDCDWSARTLDGVLIKLTELEPDLVLLQFTPLMYRGTNHPYGHDLVDFWRNCSERWITAAIIHETYFRAWWYPPSWIRGLREKALLQRMVRHSRFVFSASQPLIAEIAGWESRVNVSRLPIGSNFPTVEINRDTVRLEHGIAADEIVLVLFGGGNSLKWMRNHVHITDALLHSKGIKAKWLMLGGIPDSWFKMKLPIVSPGRLNEQEISIRLLTADIFLMPHYAGLCAKRGTLMAAMQNGLPVVGCRTAMTDQFWGDIAGVRLTHRCDAWGFARQVLELSQDREIRIEMGKENQRYFFRQFTWEAIAQTLVERVAR